MRIDLEKLKNSPRVLRDLVEYGTTIDGEIVNVEIVKDTLKIKIREKFYPHYIEIDKYGYVVAYADIEDVKTPVDISFIEFSTLCKDVIIN